MEQFQISAKNLGRYAMPDFCPRCEWIRLHAKKLPYQIFPGIFSTIDAYTKKIVHGWIDRKAGSEMLKKYKVTGYQKAPHWSKFRMETKYGIMLSGAVDDIWTCDGGIVIPDYKTAKYTENADKLLPMYKTQLNGYAKIAEATGLGKVLAIPLVYMEPQTDQGFVDLNSQHDNDWNMTFWPKVLELELDIESIDPLLEKARALYDGSIPDPTEGCKDCAALENIIGYCK
jgi:hypothetical protein